MFNESSLVLTSSSSYKALVNFSLSQNMTKDYKAGGFPEEVAGLWSHTKGLASGAHSQKGAPMVYKGITKDPLHLTEATLCSEILTSQSSPLIQVGLLS